MIIWFIFSTVSLLLAYLSQKNILPIAYKPAKVFLVIWLSGFVNFGGKGMVDQLNYVKAYQNFNDASVLNVFTWVNLHIEALSTRFWFCWILIFLWIIIEYFNVEIYL
jgi:hypothetical protein